MRVSKDKLLVPSLFRRDLMPVTVAVNNDEQCWGISERNVKHVKPTGDEWHRQQVVGVVRNDKLAICVRDLGLAAGYHADPFDIPGGVLDGDRGYVEEKVGRLCAVADELRQRRSQSSQIEPTDLITQHNNEVEEGKLRRRHASVVGPHHRKERR